MVNDVLKVSPAKFSDSLIAVNDVLKVSPAKFSDSPIAVNDVDKFSVIAVNDVVKPSLIVVKEVENAVIDSLMVWVDCADWFELTPVIPATLQPIVAPVNSFAPSPEPQVAFAHLRFAYS